MPVSIYGLIDPRDGKIRYVGKTIQRLDYRLQQHVWTSTRRPSKRIVAGWITELAGWGLRPSIILLEEVEPDQWREAERRWGKKIQAQNALTNDLNRFGNGSTRSYVARWTPALEARLGKDADAVIAEEMGITRKAVTYRRNVLRIPASYNRARNAPPPPMGGHNRSMLPDDVVGDLGRFPDHVLAKRAGVSKKAINIARRARGVASFAETTGATGQFRKGNYPARWRRG